MFKFVSRFKEYKDSFTYETLLFGFLENALIIWKIYQKITITKTSVYQNSIILYSYYTETLQYLLDLKFEIYQRHSVLVAYRKY